MISVSTTYDNIISNGGHYEWQVLNGSNTWTKENLISGSLEYSVFRKLTIGGTDAAQLNLTLWNVAVDTANPLVLQFRAVSETDQSEWVTKGTYYIDKLETSPYSEQTNITAFDAMLKTEVTYMVDGQWTTRTALSVAEAIAAEIDVTVSSTTSGMMTSNPINLVNSPEIGENGTTDREMLSYIGALYGGNWRINASNELELVILHEAPTAIAPVGDAVRDFDASIAEEITKVRVWVSTNGYYLSPPLPLQTHTLEDITTHDLDPIEVYATLFEAEWNELSGAYIEANIPFYGSQAVAENLYNLFKGKSFIPYQSDRVFIDPKYEVGDGITIKDVTSIIATQTISIDALAVSSLVFEAQGELQSLYPYVDKGVRELQFQLSQNTALVDALGQTVSGAEYRQQTIYKSVTSVTEAPSAETTWVTDNSGSQNVWTTKRPVYSSEYPVLFIATQRQTVGQESGTECYCSTPEVDQTTTVIDGGHITTGTIDAGQVNVINIDASNIDTGTLSADRIAANSIAVGKLTGSITNGDWIINLTNGTMTIGTLSADKIKAGTIADDLTTPKNYWNLTTGQFVTTQGTLGGMTIDSDGLKATETTGSMELDAYGLTVIGAGTYAPMMQATSGGLLMGAANSAQTGFYDTNGIIQLTTQSYTDPQTGLPTISIAQWGDATGTVGITMSKGIDFTYTALNLTAQTVTVNNHQILEVH